MKKSNGDKPGEAKLRIVPTEEIIKKKLYTFRRVKSSKISLMAQKLARACAEDANTAYYVDEYRSGNFNSREDYIEYMADKFQFIANGGKL